MARGGGFRARAARPGCSITARRSASARRPRTALVLEGVDLRDRACVPAKPSSVKRTRTHQLSARSMHRAMRSGPRGRGPAQAMPDHVAGHSRRARRRPCEEGWPVDEPQRAEQNGCSPRPPAQRLLGAGSVLRTPLNQTATSPRASSPVRARRHITVLRPRGPCTPGPKARARHQPLLRTAPKARVDDLGLDAADQGSPPPVVRDVDVGELSVRGQSVRFGAFTEPPRRVDVARRRRGDQRQRRAAAREPRKSQCAEDSATRNKRSSIRILVAVARVSSALKPSFPRAAPGPGPDLLAGEERARAARRSACPGTARSCCSAALPRTSGTSSCPSWARRRRSQGLGLGILLVQLAWRARRPRQRRAVAAAVTRSAACG